MPPILTHGGVIKDYIAGEDIKNNDIYIVDTETQHIRKPKNPSEWFYCQVFMYMRLILGLLTVLKKDTW